MNVLRRSIVPLFAAAALAACGGGGGDTAALNQDSTLARDLEMAGQRAGDVSLGDTAAAKTAPAPARQAQAKAPAPRPTPAPARPAAATPTPSGTIPVGTVIRMTADAQVCTNTNQVGDTFTATVSSDVTGENGGVIPAGSQMTFEITRLVAKTNMANEVVLDIAAKSLKVGNRTYPVSGAGGPDITKIRTESRSDDVKKVAAGAAVGAVAGAILGKGTKGAITGAAAGTAAGVGVAAATSRYEGCINAGNLVQYTVAETITLRR
jgi:hypothetical protein